MKILFLLLLSVSSYAQVVTDFTDVTDSLEVHFNSPGQPTEIFKGKTRPITINLPAGKDQIYLTSNRSSNPRPFEKIMQFSARVDSMNLTHNLSVNLGQIVTKQSRILIRKQNLSNTPQIIIGGKTYTMQSSTNYWYAYVTGASCQIKASLLGGGTIDRALSLKAGETYIATFVTVSVKTDEVFKTVKNI